MKFEPIFVEGRNIDETWFLLLKEAFEKGRRYRITEGSYKGHDRIAMDFVSGFVHNPHERPLAPQVPPHLPPVATDEDGEKYFVEYLMDSSLAPNEDYKYATWIVGGDSKLYFTDETLNALPEECRKRAKLLGKNKKGENIYEIEYVVPNQVEWVIRHFREKGFGNEHCFITVGDPTVNLAYDVPYSTETERRTSPCLRGLDFRIINDDGKNYLLTHVVYRSWDLVGGWPTNMMGFTLLNEYVAESLGIEPGPLSFSCKSLHCYDFHEDYLKARLGK